MPFVFGVLLGFLFGWVVAVLMTPSPEDEEFEFEDDFSDEENTDEYQTYV